MINNSGDQPRNQAEALDAAAGALARALKQADLAAENAGLGPIPSELFQPGMQLVAWLEERRREIELRSWGLPPS